MSSDAYVPPLRIELGPSRRLLLWRRATHLAALLTLPMLQSFLLAVAVAVLLGASFLYRREQPSLLLWRSDDVWELSLPDGSVRTAVIAGPAFVHPALVIVMLRDEQRSCCRRIIIVPDMLPKEIFRRLRVRLNGRQRPVGLRRS